MGAIAAFVPPRCAVKRRSAKMAISAARRSDRSESPPYSLACIRQVIRLISHCLFRPLVDSPQTSANLSLSSLTVIRSI
jgi:hypothetical protein